ncbi:hypothetical protein D9757_005229 [Collybiopsis confluens]|uniref:Translation initiation factor IF-3 n=1 Tax=Collybiopsis confluens TaxID=2823264 RepID=A0A8H5HVS8_9AGAR|nr:hypothetical protein D9757_005229 [Collybiopsis confluens]
MATFLAFRLAAKRVCTGPVVRVYPAAAATTARRRLLHVSATNHSKYQKPRNKSIPYTQVHLVDRANDGKLVKMALNDLLAQIDDENSYVELQVTDPVPIVRIVDREEAAERRKLAKERQKESKKKNVKKEFQFTWGMAVADLEHKLARASEELKKGHRVDLVFGPKKRTAAPSVGEMKEKMQLMADKVADVGVEWKSRELQRGIGAIFMQSRGVQSGEEES